MSKHPNWSLKLLPSSNRVEDWSLDLHTKISSHALVLRTRRRRRRGGGRRVREYEREREREREMLLIERPALHQTNSFTQRVSHFSHFQCNSNQPTKLATGHKAVHSFITNVSLLLLSKEEEQPLTFHSITLLTHERAHFQQTQHTQQTLNHKACFSVLCKFT